MSVRSRFAFVASLACLGINAASALTVPELQRLLKTETPRSLVFEETRESPWLAVPVQSRGTLHSSPGMLEKRVMTPRQETWRLSVDRMQWIGPDGATSKEILFSDSSAVAALANALRHIVAADLDALAADFYIELRGDERQWAVRLRPRSAAVRRQIDYLELQGEVSAMKTIVVVEPQGERTTTRIHS